MLSAVLGGLKPTLPQRKAVSNGAAVQMAISGARCHLYIVKAICPGQKIYLGTDNTVDAATGYPMVDGETLTMEPEAINDLWHYGSGAGCSLSVWPFVRRA